MTGTERARSGLQGSISYLQNVVDGHNASHSAESQIGLIAQRLPGLAWRASDAGDPGYRLTDMDPLTGEQRLPWRRFDDVDKPFSAYQVDPTDPNQRGDFQQALVLSAYSRQALAPLWQGQTANQQADAGVGNAGLSEEERAAKAGLSAALDSPYAASHPNNPQAASKRLGSLRVVGLDLDGDGRYNLGSAIRTQHLGYRTISCHKWSTSVANGDCWSKAA